jgi:2-methylcitrate dehydratase
MIAKKLARWAVQLKYENLPEKSIKKAKEQLFGILGATYHGCAHPYGKTVASFTGKLGDKKEAKVVGFGVRTSARSAAFANSALAQIFEYEDWIKSAHTGAAIVPTVIATAELMDSSGKELLLAQIIGNEIAGRIGEAITLGRWTGNQLPIHQVETSMVASKLLGLDEKKMLNALGISCSMGMQSCFAGWRAPVKILLTAFPSHCGILSAQLASEGMEAPDDLLEHPLGFLQLVSEVVEYEKIVEGLGKEWRMDTLHTKPYPACGFTVSAVECALEIVKKHEISPDEISSVMIKAPATSVATSTIFRYRDPLERVLKGEWSFIPLLFDLQYPVALAIVYHKLTPDEWEEEKLKNPAVRETAGKISVKQDPVLDFLLLTKFWFGSEVIIQAKNGKFRHKVWQMLGSPERPFPAEEKFRSGAQKILPGERIDDLISKINGIESIDISGLSELL